MDESDDIIHATGDLSLGEEPPLPIQWEGVLALEAIWTPGRRAKSFGAAQSRTASIWLCSP
jgi:hypothetical protein